MGIKKLAQDEQVSIYELFGMDSDWVAVAEKLPEYGDAPLFFSRKSPGYLAVKMVLAYPYLQDAMEKICKMGYATRRDFESRWDEEV